ncbi:MAG TPA: DUF1304 family protein [Nocardioides sp.]|nr:DUF1304 family protein [Nocardioides sp.]
MNVTTEVCAAISALVLIVVFPTEAFFIRDARVQRFLGIEPEGIDHVHLWSFCIGARNALAGIGTLIGIWMLHNGHHDTGATVVVVGCIYMLVASLFMGVADALGYWRPRGGSIRGTIASSILPAVALVALAF